MFFLSSCIVLPTSDTEPSIALHPAKSALLDKKKTYAPHLLPSLKLPPPIAPVTRCRFLRCPYEGGSHRLGVKLPT